MELDTILYVQLDAWSVWSFAHPHVKILPFSRLEEEDVVAVVEICDLIQVIKLRLRV